MSPADETKGPDGTGKADQTSVMMSPVSADTGDVDTPETEAGTTAAGNGVGGNGVASSGVPGSAAAPKSRAEDGESTASVPPWQRMTSEVRRPEEESPYAPASEYPDGYAGYSASGSQVLYADNEPTMNNMAPVAPPQPAYQRPEPESPRRTAVNLGGLGASNRQPGGSTPSALRRPGRGPRRASLQVKRVDPWSVLKLALVLSVALFFVWLVAVGVLYGVLDGMGVWDKLNGTYSDLVQPGQGGNNEPLISAGRVFSIAAIVGGINIVLMTALSTVAAFIYNVSADLAGGLEITLAERE